MKLADVKRLAVRRGLSVCFRLPGGRECVVDAHGLARVPGLDGPPGFNLEDEFARAQDFVLDAAVAEPQRRSGSGGRRVLTRRDLEELLASGPSEPAGKPAEE